MDPEQTFIRVQERFSHMLTPKLRTVLEYTCLCIAMSLFAFLVVMHANYVQQPGCSSEIPTVDSIGVQLVQIKITSSGMWSENYSISDVSNDAATRLGMEGLDFPMPKSDKYAALAEKFRYSVAGLHVRKDKLSLNFWSPETELLVCKNPDSEEDRESVAEDLTSKINRPEMKKNYPASPKETIRATLILLGRKWRRFFQSRWIQAKLKVKCFQKLRNVTGIHLNLNVPDWFKVFYLHRLNSIAVEWLEMKTEAFEPTYIYATEKGFFLLPDEAKVRHNIKTTSLSISAHHSCFGNRWQQLMINRIVGYDTILINSLLTSSEKGGYLYNFQSNEFFNLSYGHESAEGPGNFGDYLVTKCGVLMMSLFVFFTTTLSVSFTLRETQTRMLKFTVQLQHHARHRLPTFQLIFVHVIESLVFVPIMVGILFFLFEFYHDQLLAFMVLILVWLCELFTLISVRTPISMKFFPRFFLLYFLVFHIYFFSYSYGFSYLALCTTAAFMQHLILHFWNRFEVPALQISRRSQLQQQPHFHITSSTILASTLHITRLGARNHGPGEMGMPGGPGLTTGPSARNVRSGMGITQPEPPSPDSGAMNSFSSLLLWILGGRSPESLNSFLSIFRDVGDQGTFNDRENQDAH